MRSPDAKPYTYLIHWTDHGISYYGFRCGNQVAPVDDLWKLYFTSSQYVQRFREENGEPDVVMVDKIFDDKDVAKLYETEYLRNVGVPGNLLWLNRTDGSKNFFHGNKHSAETKQLFSDQRRGKPRRPPSEATRQKIGDARRGKPGHKHSDLTKHRMSKARQGKVHSEEAKQRISDSKKGQVFTQTHKDAIRKAKLENPWVATDEQRAKISNAHTGRKQTQEWIDKRTSKLRGNTYGPLSDEHRAKVSASLKGRTKPPRSPEHTKKQQEARMRTLALKQ